MQDKSEAKAAFVKSQDDSRLRRYVGSLTILWTVIFVASLCWNLFQLNQTTEELARIQARAEFQKDVLYRRWNTLHGGVYAPISDDTPPNPYLEVPERDIQTPSGRQLTLINPAYMTRQVHELSVAEDAILGHITSLNPIRPENAADPWEAEALLAFENGETEQSAIAEMRGVNYMRLMRPLITEASCLACHAKQGYQEGDIRGGISISVPMAPFQTTARKYATNLIAAHSALWLFGLFGIALAARRFGQGIRERARVQQALRELNLTLEAQVAARTKQIRAEQGKSEAILRSVGDAIAMANLEQQIQYINDAFVSLTGYSADEAVGQPFSFLIAEGRRGLDWQTLRASVESGKIWQGETVFGRRDGRTYSASVTVAPMVDEMGQLVGYVLSHRDNSRQEDLERARSRFITSISHELRTPITNVKLYANLIKTNQQPEKTEQYLNVLAEQTGRLEHLTQDILDLLILESRRGEMVWTPVSLAGMISDVPPRFQDQAENAGLVLEIMPVPADLPPVKGDRLQLFRALTELIQNAISFSPAGAKLVIEANTTRADGMTWVTIAVKDTGPGISPEEQGQLFDRFFRGSLAQAGHIPGTGLGLSIVQEIMNAHGGRVTVESQVGQGSTFKLWLRRS